MNKHLTEKEKQVLVTRYKSGEKVADLCLENNISKSTLYNWVKLHTTISSENSNINFTVKNYYDLQRRYNKLLNKIEILSLVKCSINSPLKERLSELENLYGKYSVHELCEALNVDRGTFYNHVKRNKKENNYYKFRREMLSEKVLKIYESTNQILGANKIAAILHAQDINASANLVGELMNEMNLRSMRNGAKKEHLKLINEGKKNKINLAFNVKKPNEVWVSDITYLNYNNIKFFICVIIDLYARRVISYSISTSQSTNLVTKTLRLALCERTPTEELIFHSDRGGQFVSYAFKKLLADNNIEQSFSPSGRPQHNAVMESFFASLKREELYRKRYKSERELRAEVSKYIVFYNNVRPHTKNNYKTPTAKESKYYNE